MVNLVVRLRRLMFDLSLGNCSISNIDLDQTLPLVTFTDP